MAKGDKKTKKGASKTTWFAVALFAALLTVPHASMIKIMSNNFDPQLINLIRFSIGALICLPMMKRSVGMVKGKTAFKVVTAGLAMSIAGLSFTAAVQASQASYVSMLLTLSPAIFVIYSAIILKEKVTTRSRFGVGVAFFGSLVVALVPMLAGSSGVQFFPLATILCVANLLIYPYVTVTLKSLNSDHKLPMIAAVGYIMAFSMVSSFIIWWISGAKIPQTIDSFDIAFLLYMGVLVLVIARVLNIWAFQRIGSAPIATLGYFESFLAIILPLFVFGEVLSVPHIIGGLLILSGVLIVDSKRFGFGKQSSEKHA